MNKNKDTPVGVPRYIGYVNRFVMFYNERGTAGVKKRHSSGQIIYLFSVRDWVDNIRVGNRPNV